MCFLRSSASETSLTTLGDSAADADSASSSTLQPSIALTISAVHSEAASMPPWSIQTETPAPRNCSAITRMRSRSFEE